eukprot:gb/GFBE01016734.1/.p1 GENE.gb/GFBE01016734.1/~~gb/GFBE01016734.1/.p1  ORF type:complete len:353 (+),score=78.47 gb/GFBE01016734.1/:1-1059(+)
MGLSLWNMFSFMMGPPGVPIWIVVAFDTLAVMFVGAIVLMFLPKKLLAKSKMLRTVRNKIARSCARVVELSMQGPFAVGIVWLGRKAFRGRLSSVPKAPVGLSLKAEGTYDVEATFSPSKGWNPFHEENYVIAWKKADSEGGWLERHLNQHEECEDLSGKQKKGEKYKVIVDGLPIFTALKFRMCATSYKGRGPWSREVGVTTLAVPSKDFGFTGPLGPAWEKLGGGKSEYRWLQTRNEVHIKITIGPDVRGKDIKFKALPTKLQIDFAVDGENLRLLHGYLSHRINPDDAAWYIDESKEDGRHIQITLFKTEMMERWSRVFDGDEHPMIDERHVQWFVDSLNPGSLGDLYE